MSDKALIGEYLGTTEEYMPGDGAYSEDGKVYAAVIGEKNVDAERHQVTVKGKEMPEMKIGKIVYGQVQGIRKSMINIIVSRVAGLTQEIDVKTGLYVSNIADAYVDKVEEFFGIGDIVKAKIIKMDNDLIDVTTKEDDLGVVKAFCKVCRTPLMHLDGMNMECPGCKHKEKRKVSSDYMQVSSL